MLPLTKYIDRLQRKELAFGIIAISGAVLVAATLISAWALTRDRHSSPQLSTVAFEVSVPEEIAITEHFSGSTMNGAPLELSGNAAALEFQGGYLKTIDLPVLYSSGQYISSLSDHSTGIYLEQDNTGQRTLRFPLISTQKGMTMIITGTVETVQSQDQGSRTSISLTHMEATVDIPSVQTTGEGVPYIAQSRLVFDLHRLPRNARLKISRIDEFDVSTRSSIDSVLDEMSGPWTTALAVEATRTNLDNGEDVGEASLYVTLHDLDQSLLNRLIVVHVDESGHAEQLLSEAVSKTGDETVLRFVSPRGLSTFAVMVPSSDVKTSVTPTATPRITPSSPPSPIALTPTATEEATPTTQARPTPIPSQTLAATATATPTTKATLVPSPIGSTPTSVLNPTSPKIPTPSPPPTLTPISTPTSALNPTSPKIPTPSPPPTLTPISTPTSIPTPDEHYAAIVHTSDPVAQQWFLDIIGTNWYLDWLDDVDEVPIGHEEMITILSLPGPSTERIQEIANLSPGSVWYIVGEPNRRTGYRAADIVEQLHTLYEAIKDADPSAKITSPSVLNWEFTCNGCSGFQQGREWIDEFRAAYLAQNGMEPPIDIWAIDLYPLDWFNLPTVDHQLIIDQVIGMRAYLNATGQADKSIWITELGLHWGWDDMLLSSDEGYDTSCNPFPQPIGTYRSDLVIGYLDAIFDWLDVNADSNKIEKWFLLGTYENINECNSSAYAGITLFDAQGVGANLTKVGQFFRNRVLGISP